MIAVIEGDMYLRLNSQMDNAVVHASGRMRTHMYAARAMVFIDLAGSFTDTAMTPMDTAVSPTDTVVSPTDTVVSSSDMWKSSTHNMTVAPHFGPLIRLTHMKDKLLTDNRSKPYSIRHSCSARNWYSFTPLSTSVFAELFHPR